MTMKLNAGLVDFATTTKEDAATTVRPDVQVNHAALAACLCALVLIGILLLPTIYTNAASVDSAQPLGPSQEYLVQSNW